VSREVIEQQKLILTALGQKVIPAQAEHPPLSSCLTTPVLSTKLTAMIHWRTRGRRALRESEVVDRLTEAAERLERASLQNEPSTITIKTIADDLFELVLRVRLSGLTA
jgi:hypothetical protein